jgi:hypothetical protein
MLKQMFSVLLVSVFFVSCGGNTIERKVLVMGRGEIQANGTNVVLKEGAGHAEQTIDLEGDATELAVETGSGKTNIKVPAGEGYYILNLKKDTLIGSRQLLGSDLNRKGVMTQEELRATIDSLERLTTGANIKEGGLTSIIYPNELKKISSDGDARVYGPFNNIPGAIEPGKDGKEPELYKFYTNTQMRERVTNLKKATY